MILRFIILVILTYLIFRSIGNLIRASRGQSGSPNRVDNGGGTFRFDIRNVRESMRSRAQQGRRRDQQQDQYDRRQDQQQRQQPDRPQSQDSSPPGTQKYPEDIEDAHWTDLN